jgi:acyl dehydratase
MIEITDVRSLATRIGEEIAVSDWFEISQQRIDQFAAATGDSHWIHVDPARAAVDSPFKTTIAHGFLTLSLLSSLIRDAMTFSGLRMAINYGLNRVRFITPVPSGARVRARITAAAVAETGDSVQVTWGVIVERERSDKPCCVAEWIVRYYP